MIVISLIIATVLPLIILYMIYRLDLYATGSFKTVVACFVWGGISLALALMLGNQIVLTWGWVDQQTYSRFVAPTIEEILKALILIFLVRRAQFTYFVDGAIYGVAVGIGFAVFENTLYLSNNPDISVAISRVISTNLMHATATGIVGIALGWARFHGLALRIIGLLSGLTIAILIHAGFNNLVTRMNGRFLLLYAAMVGILGIGFIIFVIKRGLAEQKKWIDESLGELDRVTAGETAVVQRIDDVYTILAPVATQFGAEKAQKIEDFLFLQARVGILRNSAEKIKDDKIRSSVNSQISKLQEEIDDARRDVGPYCMIYLRNIFPEQKSPIWPLLTKRINTRAEVDTTQNIWATLSARTSPTQRQ